MIGLSVRPEELSIAEEFFQLFKTGWEIYNPAHSYDVVLSTGGALERVETRLLVIYSSRLTTWDAEVGRPICRQQRASLLTIKEETFPLYGEVAFFGPAAEPIISWTEKQSSASGLSEESTLVRIGYDLFSEISYLLTNGQPPEYAIYPTLDQHIAALRRVIIDAGIPVVEIPPTPAGKHFIACLTHDIDFFSLCQHRFDRTMFGFLARATAGAVFDACRGRIGFRRMAANWSAAAKLPFVHAGFCEDFWRPFERYLKADGRPATYFLIPFKGRDGRAPDGKNSRGRATKCDITDAAADASRLRENGSEVALHGIDAWTDPEAARVEMDQIRNVTGDTPRGVRMHWLYFDRNSPRHLDAAGFDYDATCGYNEAVGYRAGTAQVFKPLSAEHMLELPFQIQDTALFFGNRMGLSERDARKFCLRLLQNSHRFGGVMTLSWHDRSLVPERLWGNFYSALLKEIDAASPWFGTARGVVSWFRNRREISIIATRHMEHGLEITLENVPSGVQPDFAVRLSWKDNSGQFRQKDAPLAGRNAVFFESNCLSPAVASCVSAS